MRRMWVNMAVRLVCDLPGAPGTEAGGSDHAVLEDFQQPGVAGGVPRGGWEGFSGPGVVDKTLKYLEDSKILTYQYGVPTSLHNTGQQWDFPNAWAPLQDLAIRGLAKSPSPRTQAVAFRLAQNWVRTNFDVYSHTSAMYEKYDISSGGQPGGGGEYEVQIYCHGDLLHQVQMARLFKDDKHFVDMPLAAAPDQVLQRFQELAVTHNHSVPRPQLQAFLQEYFQAAGQELQPWTPEDWKDSPGFLQKISDPRLRAWAGQLHQLWKKLGKKVKPEVLHRPERFSLIYSRHPFIVPGGRFLEFYYWDSYWVMEGLLLSEMPATVKGMLQNFLDLVQTYGHIPNGARVYYLQRSQPPLLALMMDRYVTHTDDIAFLRDNIGTLALELDFWTQNRTISVSLGTKSYVLNRYYVPYGGPRPESYSKDAELADTLPAGSREALWAELKAGAESGWDFSSRWLAGGRDPSSLSSIRTSKFVPVDLNAFLCQAEGLMGKFYAILGNDSQAKKYRNLREQRLAAMKAVLWNEEKGAWFDYDLEHGKTQEFYPSNLAPLWADCFSDPGVVDKTLKYLEDSKILTYQYGVPTSLHNTGQQWDFPNAWAPLQDLAIRGLAKSPSPRTQAVAFRLAQNWVRTNFDVYSHTSAMYEKYDISSGGQPGGGGEYEVQEGFGWTNGVALMLLDRYGDRLSSGTPGAFLEHPCLAAALLLSLLPSLLPQ